MIIHAGDTLPRLEDTLLLQGEAVDLSGETNVVVTFSATNANGDEIDGTADVYNDAAGIVRYDWLAGDTDTPGVYYGGWTVTHDGGQFTSPGLSITIYEPAEFWASPQDVADITGATLDVNLTVRALQQAQDAIRSYVSRVIAAPAPVRVKRATALLAARIATAPKDADDVSSQVVQESIGDYSVRFARPSYSGSISDPEMHEDVRKLLSPWRPSNYNSSTSDELGGVEIDRNTPGYTGGGGVSTHSALLGLTAAGAHPASAVSVASIAELVGVDDVQEALELLASQTSQAIQDALNAVLAEQTARPAFLSGVVAPVTGNGVDGDFYYDRVTKLLYGPKAVTWPAGVSLAGAPGTTDHGAQTGLGDDDHTQYLTNARGDARYDAIGAAAAAAAASDPAGTAAAAVAAAASSYATAAHNHTGVYAPLAGSPGTPDGTKYLRDDGTWVTPAGGGGGGDLVAANNLSDLASAATARTNLGLGTAATTASTAYDAAGTAAALVDDLSGVSDAATARTNLGLGTAATTAASAYATSAQGATADAAAAKASNLSDLASAATARTNLGLGTAATTASTAYATAAQGATADTNANHAKSATYTLIYNGTNNYVAANSGTIPAGAIRRFVGNTDPSTGPGGSFTLATGDEWVDTSA